MLNPSTPCVCRALYSAAAIPTMSEKTVNATSQMTTALVRGFMARSQEHQSHEEESGSGQLLDEVVRVEGDEVDPGASPDVAHQEEHAAGDDERHGHPSVLADPTL